MAIYEQFMSLKQIQTSDDSTSCAACVEQKLVMQVLTNNVLLYMQKTTANSHVWTWEVNIHIKC